jgi:hypothetical protein
MALIKDTGESPAEIIRRALDVYFKTDPPGLDWVSEIVQEAFRDHLQSCHHLSPCARNEHVLGMAVDGGYGITCSNGEHVVGTVRSKERHDVTAGVARYGHVLGTEEASIDRDCGVSCPKDEHDMSTCVAQNEHVARTRKVSAPLRNQPEKIKRIKEVWATGERNRREIARQVGVHDDAVNRWIKAALIRGELQETSP